MTRVQKSNVGGSHRADAPVQWRMRIGICLAPPSLVSFTNLVLLHCSVGKCCRQLHLKLCALLLFLSLRIDRRSEAIKSTDQRSQREVQGGSAFLGGRARRAYLANQFNLVAFPVITWRDCVPIPAATPALPASISNSPSLWSACCVQCRQSS